MSHLIEIFLCLGYTALFVFLIIKWSFYKIPGINKAIVVNLFLLKVLAGFVLTYIYTYYYTDRSTADIYKYFDDSMIMFNALWEQPMDYFRMLLGIQNNNEHFNGYYNQMNHWYRGYSGEIYNDNHTIIRFNALVRIFSMGYINVHTVFICFFSFTGLLAIYKTFFNYLEDKKYELIVAVFLLPTVLFWGSGVLKEGILFFGIGLLIYFFHEAIRGFLNKTSIIWILFSLVLLAVTKFYLLLAALPGFIANLWIEKTDNKKVFLKYLISYGIFTIVALNLHHFTNLTNPLLSLTNKQDAFIRLAKGGAYLLRINAEVTDTIYVGSDESFLIEKTYLKGFVSLDKISEYQIWKKGVLQESIPLGNNESDSYKLIVDFGKTGSRIEIIPLSPDFLSFLKAAPAAIWNAMFRPHLFESRSPLILMTAVENIFILLTGLTCFFFFDPKVFRNKMFFFCVFVSVIILLLVGWVTPVLGAIARYKAPALPFIMIAFLLVLDKSKVLPLLQKIKNIFGQTSEEQNVGQLTMKGKFNASKKEKNAERSTYAKNGRTPKPSV